eukprot:gene3475-19147_t
MWHYGDLMPYIDRDVPMSLRETFAYVLHKEEPMYPDVGGETREPMEPSRWRGGRRNDFGVLDFQVTTIGHIQREMEVKNVRAVVSMDGYQSKPAVFARFRDGGAEKWIQAAGEKADRTTHQAMTSDAVHADVKAAIPYVDVVTKTIPGSPAERKVQGRQLTWQSFRHGVGVAFCTPNLDTTMNPILACLAYGPPIAGDLINEPASSAHCVRLTDMSPRLQKYYESIVTFARDPLALYQMTSLMWDVLWEHGMGLDPRAKRWRDGVAASSMFPGLAGVLRSGNGPAEWQDRGMLHIHCIFYAILRLSAVELMAMSRRCLEKWMEACVLFVNRTQYASGRAVARALAVPEPACVSDAYQLPVSDARHRGVAAKATFARALQEKQLAGDNVDEDVTGWVNRIYTEDVALAAACSIMLSASPRLARIHAYEPGWYVTIAVKTTVSEGIESGSADVRDLDVGERIKVHEVVHRDDMCRVRGRFEGGWVSMHDLSNGRRWVWEA